MNDLMAMSLPPRHPPHSPGKCSTIRVSSYKGFGRWIGESHLPPPANSLSASQAGADTRPSVLSPRFTTSDDFKMPLSMRVIRRERLYYNGTVVQPSIQERRGLPACPVLYVPEEHQDECEPEYPIVNPRRLPSAPVMRCVGLPTDSPASVNPPPATPHRTPRRSRGLHWPSARVSPSKPSTQKLGPFEFLRQLHSGSFGSAVSARDLSSGRNICLKIVDKQRVALRSKELKALHTELRGYQVIADSAPCRFILDCHGVFQDEQFVYFAMVSENNGGPPLVV